MTVAIVGSRDFKDKDFVEESICSLFDIGGFFAGIISGGASGVDTIAKKIAEEYGVPFTEYEADWKTYGKSAGPIRNELIVKDCDLLIAFWDGISPGTKSSIDIAKRLKKTTVIFYI
jgi:hypothetical protein